MAAIYRVHTKYIDGVGNMTLNLALQLALLLGMIFSIFTIDRDGRSPFAGGVIGAIIGGGIGYATYKRMRK